MTPWWKRVRESQLPRGPAGELGVTLSGGADRGQFPYLATVPSGCQLTGEVHQGDLLLEVNGTPVFGLTLGDTRGILKSCKDPIRLRTVAPGADLSRDLSEFLQKSCSCDSRDSDLQRIVRENLYLRAVPCTTREPHDGEIPDMDYKFVSTQEFLTLQRDGLLLESGTHKGHYYGTRRPAPVTEDCAMTYRELRRHIWGPGHRYLSISAQDGVGDQSDEGEQEEEEDERPGVMMGLRAATSGGCPSLRLQNGTLGLRREIPGCVDPSSANKASGALSSNWKKETVENLGLNFSAQAPPLLQVVRTPQGLPAPDRGTTTCGDFMVVVHGNCIVEYSKGERLTLHPAVPRSDPVDDAESQEQLHPLLPPSRAPACGQEAETAPELESPGKRPLEPSQTEPKHHQRIAPASSPTKPTVTVPLLGQPRLPLPSYDALTSRPSLKEGPSPPRRPVGPLKVGHGGSKPTSDHTSEWDIDSPTTAARLTPVPLSRSSIGLGFQLTDVGPAGGAAVGDIWDHRACPLLAEGDKIVKANGADLRHLTATQVQEVLRRRTLEGDMVLLVQRQALRFPVTSTVPSSDVAIPCLSHTASHRPHLLQTVVEDGAAPSKGPPCLQSPGAMDRGREGKDRRVAGEGTSKMVRAATEGGGSRNEATQCEGRSLGGDKEHNRGHKLYSQPGMPTMARPCQQLLESFEGWAAPENVIKATSFMDPVPCDLVLCQKSLQDLVQVPRQTSHEYTGLPSLGTVDPVPSPTNSPAAGPGTAARMCSSNSNPATGPGTAEPLSSSNSSLATVAPMSSTNSSPATRPGIAAPISSSNSSLATGALMSSTNSSPSTGPGTVAHISSTNSSPATGLATMAPLPLPTRNPTTGPADRPHRASRLAELELERREHEGFGFVIISEIPASGKEARSLVPHKVSEVRKDSPADRDGHLKVGDRVEGVDGRSIAHMSPREITQLFRQAGNKIRLRILPKTETDVESISEAAEIEVDEKRTPSSPVTQGPRAPQPVESRKPQGQVSDQLLEINGTRTVGMSHAEAVEQIRSGGNKIKLVLRRGNGYIPDYDTQGPRSPSFEALPEAGARPTQRDLDLEPPKESRGQGAPESSTRKSAPHCSRDRPGTPKTPKEDQSSHREGRPRGRRSEVRGETSSQGRSQALPQQAPRECRSLSPQRGRVLGTGPRRGANSLMGPRLRPSVEAGPWLVPSPERLSHTLRKGGSLPQGQRAQGGFAGDFLGTEAGEREKWEAVW
ncbi:membrane-associated guanylate kinase, WW and PDZ domain-containing protein 1-like isoform X2 [Pleurodeles waltl]|uniref:membrane-associated guanylate kinase, WW and PDZ domain-containing protein 1-like isoform X2 n=1 Tax=Pleurodeles waltl TaxID=8319 RepID=UPI003709BCD8